MYPSRLVHVDESRLFDDDNLFLHVEKLELNLPNLPYYNAFFIILFSSFTGYHSPWWCNWKKGAKVDHECTKCRVRGKYTSYSWDTYPPWQYLKWIQVVLYLGKETCLYKIGLVHATLLTLNTGCTGSSFT